jgi:Rrf2 family protein
MMRAGLITRNTDYAIRAVAYIAANVKAVTSVSEMVKALGMPRPFLRKILQVLNRKGFLTSYRGKAGGFKLALEPGEIFILDLIKVFQGPVRLTECIFKKRLCPRRTECALRKKLSAIEGNVLKELRSVTIASLLR